MKSSAALGMRRLFLLGVCLCTLLLAPVVRAEPSARELVSQLFSDNVGERSDAAKQLRDQGLDRRAIEPLIIAAKRESDHGALREMLVTLGYSGALEALGILQLHAASPAENLRQAGREGLRVWLRVNGKLGPDDPLPEEFLWGPPPRFDADRPAGQPLPGHPQPFYETPPSNAVPPGFQFDCVARKGLVIAGAAVFGATYVASASYGIIAIAAGADATAWIPIIPIAGALIIGIDTKAQGFGIMWLVDGVAQVGGLAMLIAGLSARRLQLAPLRHASLEITPGGMSVRAEF